MEPHHQEEINKNAGEISETDRVGGAYKVAANVKVRPIGAMGTMAARLTLIYVVVAALWILVSDQVLVALVSDHTLLMKLEVMKGWAFVSVTAALLFFLMRRETRHWMAEKCNRCQPTCRPASPELQRGERKRKSKYFNLLRERRIVLL